MTKISNTPNLPYSQHSQVSIIPARKRHPGNGDQFRNHKNLRVAAYCRVSTEEESQETSYTTQKNHYTSLIAGQPGWNLAGIYADEGKTGTTRRGRIRFNELMADCRAGKVDYIITKSISRFARNTVDALDCVHELQRLDPPVGVYFERENIDTLNAGSELFLTFYCSMAQEESHSISENIKWSLQKNFRSGKPQINLRRMLGYDMCRDGNWVINKEESTTIRYIYDRFLEGASANAIARELNHTGRFTVNGKNWRADGVLYILRNEKYAGDLIMQKTYTESFLTHKAVKNTGQVPQYFKQDHHPAIISRDVWNKTQELLTCRRHGWKHPVEKAETSEGELEISINRRGKNTQEIYSMQADHAPLKGGISNPFAMLTCAYCKTPMKRMSYNAYLKDYKDHRSHTPDTIPPEESNYVDSYTFSYGVWKCSCSNGRNNGCGMESKSEKDCQACVLPEISIKQSFMELLYRIKQDIICNGDNAEIMVSFRQIYHTLQEKEIPSEFIEQKKRLLELEITELERNYRMALNPIHMTGYTPNSAEIWLEHSTDDSTVNPTAKIGDGEWEWTDNPEKGTDKFDGFSDEQPDGLTDKPRKITEYSRDNFANKAGGLAEVWPEDWPGKLKDEFNSINNGLAESLKTQIAQKRAEQNKLMGYRHITQTMKENFLVFLAAVNSLPDIDFTELSMAAKPSPAVLFPFQEYIFRTCILRMEAKGDEIHYGTAFGLILTSHGNSRPIKDYVGCRRIRKDGTSEMIEKLEQLSTGIIQHHWRPRKY